MGLFDSMFAPDSKDLREYLTTSEKMQSAIPIYGPLAALYKGGKRKAAAEKEDSVYDYVDPEDPLSGRVAERMLSRTGEETIPGMMAATGVQREQAAGKGMFDAFADTGAKLTQKGYANIGVPLAAFAEKSLPKPAAQSEAANAKLDADSNLARNPKTGAYLPNQKVFKKDSRTVGENTIEGYRQNTTDAEGNPTFGDWVPGTTTEGTRYSSKTNVNVGGTDFTGLAKLLQEPGTRAQTEAWSGFLTQTIKTNNSINDFKELAKKNPGGGLTGASGWLTEWAGRGKNLTQFFKGISGNVNAQGESEAAVLGRYSSGLDGYVSKYFPTGDQAIAKSIIVELAYSLARANNMGTAGGGRGITDADMKWAMDQLGSGHNINDMIGVLDYRAKESMRSLEVEAMKMRETNRAMNGVDDVPYKQLYEMARKPYAQSSGPQPGDIEDGHRFKGGNPADPKNWEKVR